LSEPRLSKTNTDNSKGRFSHQSKSKLGDEETRNYNNLTILQMPSTRSGKANYKVGPENHGQYANGTFASGTTKHKADNEWQAGALKDKYRRLTRGIVINRNANLVTTRKEGTTTT
jgi:hypothetical protein